MYKFLASWNLKDEVDKESGVLKRLSMYTFLTGSDILYIYGSENVLDAYIHSAFLKATRYLVYIFKCFIMCVHNFVSQLFVPTNPFDDMLVDMPSSIVLY